MATGFPVKANYATGDVLTAANMNDLAGTLNYLDPTAKGDLFPASDGSTLTRLAVGTNGQVLTADSTQTTGMKWAAAGSPSYTFTDWTPTLTQGATTITKTIDWARYAQVGNIVFVEVNMQCSSAGSAGSRVFISYPSGLTPKYTSSNGLYPNYGVGHVYDQSANAMYRGIVREDSGKFVIQPTSSTTNNDLGATDFTAAIASGDRVGFSIWYEVA